MARSKRSIDVVIDEETYRLAPLKLGQIEEFVEATHDKEDFTQSRLRTWQVIHASLANAGCEEPFEACQKRLKETLDLDGFLLLHRKALEISGLRLGETPAAAADSPSPSSAAA